MVQWLVGRHVKDIPQLANGGESEICEAVRTYRIPHSTKRVLQIGNRSQ